MLSHLPQLLQKSASEHSHLCPRQVLGARMGIAGLAAIGVQPPVTTKTALVIIETDGCFADGVRVVTGASVGHRTLKVEDMGKLAATFANLKTGLSLRLAPRQDVRTKALAYAPQEVRRYFAQLQGYQVMPELELFSFTPVKLVTPAQEIISHQNARAVCSLCGEEIINEREVRRDGLVLCRSCSGKGYYALG